MKKLGNTPFPFCFGLTVGQIFSTLVISGGTVTGVGAMLFALGVAGMLMSVLWVKL